MVAPLFKKNTLGQTNFRFSDDGFFSSGLHYKFDDVIEVRRVRALFTTKQVGYGVVAESHSISIAFQMQSGELVQVTEQPTWFSESKLERVEKLEEIFAIVCAKTFPRRLQRYEQQVQARGFFEYAGWRFYPTDGKLIDVANRRAYAAAQSKFARRFGFVSLTDQRQSAIQQRLSKEVGFSTLSDSDVIFELLRKHFGISWS